MEICKSLAKRKTINFSKLLPLLLILVLFNELVIKKEQGSIFEM